jgi:polyhydroxyalkanoate synthesis regulator phasin
MASQFSTEASPLTQAVKALDNQVNLNKDMPFPASHFLWICSGGLGSGKSTIVLNMLNLSHKKDGFRQRFQKIYMISPTATQDDKFSKLIGEVEKDGNLFEDTEDDTIEEIMARVKAHNEEMKEEGKEGSSLLLIDDCADQFSKRKKSKLNKLILCLRHLKLSVFILTQRFREIPPIIRCQCRAITWFPTLNDKENQCLIDEISIGSTLFKQLIDFAGKGEDHPFLHIKMGHGMPIFFRKFDRIIL